MTTVLYLDAPDLGMTVIFFCIVKQTKNLELRWNRSSPGSKPARAWRCLGWLPCQQTILCGWGLDRQPFLDGYGKAFSWLVLVCLLEGLSNIWGRSPLEESLSSIHVDFMQQWYGVIPICSHSLRCYELISLKTFWTNSRAQFNLRSVYIDLGNYAEASLLIYDPSLCMCI